MKDLFIGIYVLVAVSICSCSKEEFALRPLSQSEIFNCYNQTIWNEVEIRDELIGTWKWIYTEHYSVPNEGRNTENENLIIEFLNDSTLNVIDNGELDSTTKWGVVLEDGDLFGLELESPVSLLLYGRILICNNILEFNNSYRDGSDNYFKRIE